jgi:RimJ/RimL family protein N-acetyltransferase
METIQNRVVFLKGARVELRPIHEADVPTITRWINDPIISQYLTVYLPITEEDEREWLKSLSKSKGTDVVLMIVVRSKPIGIMGLHAISMTNGTGTTGAYIGESEYRGKGYAQEAKMLLLYFAFYTLNLRKIYSTVISYNGASYKYLTVSGYKRYGTRRKHHYQHGKYWDEILMHVWRKDWEKLWERFAQEHNITFPFR